MTQVTSSSDIWSVGCLIIELLTGYPPYFELNAMSAMFRIVQVRQRWSGGEGARGGRTAEWLGGGVAGGANTSPNHIKPR